MYWYLLEEVRLSPVNRRGARDEVDRLNHSFGFDSSLDSTRSLPATALATRDYPRSSYASCTSFSGSRPRRSRSGIPPLRRPSSTRILESLPLALGGQITTGACRPLWPRRAPDSRRWPTIAADLEAHLFRLLGSLAELDHRSLLLLTLPSSLGADPDVLCFDMGWRLLDYRVGRDCEGSFCIEVSALAASQLDRGCPTPASVARSFHLLSPTPCIRPRSPQRSSLVWETTKMSG